MSTPSLGKRLQESKGNDGLKHLKQSLGSKNGVKVTRTLAFWRRKKKLHHQIPNLKEKWLRVAGFFRGLETSSFQPKTRVHTLT